MRSHFSCLVFDGALFLVPVPLSWRKEKTMMLMLMMMSTLPLQGRHLSASSDLFLIFASRQNFGFSLSLTFAWRHKLSASQTDFAANLYFLSLSLSLSKWGYLKEIVGVAQVCYKTLKRNDLVRKPSK